MHGHKQERGVPEANGILPAHQRAHEQLRLQTLTVDLQLAPKIGLPDLLAAEFVCVMEENTGCVNRFEFEFQPQF